MFHSKTGLTHVDRERATPGYRIFSPLGLRNTYIINMAGEVVHSWDLPYEPGNYGYLLPNGNYRFNCLLTILSQYVFCH